MNIVFFKCCDVYNSSTRWFLCEFEKNRFLLLDTSLLKFVMLQKVFEDANVPVEVFKLTSNISADDGV